MIQLSAGQSLVHIHDDSMAHATELIFELERDSSLDLLIILRGITPALSITVRLNGINAQAHIKGIYILKDDQRVTLETKQLHYAAHTTSDCSIKGILYDASCAHYHGAIFVDSQAHHTHAAQANKNVLLSSDARAISIPSLEVLTKQVKCAHGSAVGSMDCELLFYAQSRGLSESQAKKLLLQGFVGDVLQAMPVHLIQEIQSLIR